ncbi:MAG: LysR substrate-binding domain-containing protein, partial [Lysobacter sp.]
FTRNSRSIQLTAAGAEWYEATVVALDGLQRAAGRARRIARGTGSLRVSLSARFASNWLLPRLPRWRTAHQEVELSFDVSDELRDFDADDIDAAIRFGTGRYPQTHSQRLFDTVIAPVCSPRLIEAGARFEHPRDLLQHTLCHVDWKTDGMVWPNWRMWMAAAGIDDFDDSGCVAFTDSGYVVQAVIDGGGVGLADLDMIDNDLAHGRLLRLFDIGLKVAPDYAYHLVYPQRSDEDARILALRDWLLDEIGRPATPAV